MSYHSSKTEKAIGITLIAIVILTMIFIGRLAYAESQCLSMGYSQGRLGGYVMYCVTREDGTDYVVPLRDMI